MKQDIFFDFDKNEVRTTRGGNIEFVTGKTALINRIYKVLHTAKDKYKVYFDSGFGNDFEKNLIGKALPSAFVVSEIERCVKECIGALDGINDITNFSAVRDGARVSIKFNIDTDFGAEEISEVV